MVEVLKELSDFPHHSRVGLFGAGHIGSSLYRLLKKYRPDVEVLFYIDSYLKGEVVHDKPVISIEESAKYHYDTIVITSVQFKESIAATLAEKGIENYCTISPLLITDPEYQDHGPSSGTLYAFYDLSVSSSSFDIVPFLRLAEEERIKGDYHSIHVVVVPDVARSQLTSNQYAGDSEQTIRIAKERNDWFNYHVIVPCCRLLPSCSSLTLCADRAEAEWLFSQGGDQGCYPTEYTVDHPVEGFSWSTMLQSELTDQFSGLSASDRALGYVGEWLEHHVGVEKPIVSLTIREADLDKDRDSNIEAWSAFADYLVENGYVPVFVRDTHVSMKPAHALIESYLIFREASWNLELRMALYQRSFINMFTAGGPSFLAQYNPDIRLIRFLVPRSGGFNASYMALDAYGVKEGDQFPGATAYQRTIWGAERCDTMVEQFVEMVDALQRNPDE